jgi:hypothetical protein
MKAIRSSGAPVVTPLDCSTTKARLLSRNCLDSSRVASIPGQGAGDRGGGTLELWQPRRDRNNGRRCGPSNLKGVLHAPNHG